MKRVQNSELVWKMTEKTEAAALGDAMAKEALLPADLVHMLNDLSYFDQHPNRSQSKCQLKPTSLSTASASINRQLKLPAGPDALRSSPSVASYNLSTQSLDSTPPESPNSEYSQLNAAEVSSACKNLDTTRVRGELMKFLTPSGPRKNGEGITELSQGIAQAIQLSERVVLLQMTLLVAGFIIGPSGESARSIMARTGAAIYSYSDKISGQKFRVFYIEGDKTARDLAMDIIHKAVARYKTLAEGKSKGQLVEKKQRIMGLNFYYQPPPRSLVPYAAGLRVHKSRKTKKQSA